MATLDSSLDSGFVVPVTTMQSMFSRSSSRVKSTVALPPSVTVTASTPGLKPSSVAVSR